MDYERLLNALSVLFVAIVTFLIFREALCWYWKINQRVALLEEIRDVLRGNPPTA